MSDLSRWQNANDEGLPIAGILVDYYGKQDRYTRHMATTSQTLPDNYTKSRPIRLMTANARATLSILDVAWICSEWAGFTGGPEDFEFSVIMERTTPSGVVVWTYDRDGPDAPVMLMLPSDY